MITGQRLGEAQNMRHGDLLGGIWRLAAEDTKAGREHRLKLPPLALDQVGTGEAKQLVFPGKAADHHRRAVEAEGAARRGEQRHWLAAHDLRRTCATGMQEAGISQDVVQGVLNHSIAGVGGVYLRAQMETAKAEALARWVPASVTKPACAGRRAIFQTLATVCDQGKDRMRATDTSERGLRHTG